MDEDDGCDAACSSSSSTSLTQFGLHSGLASSAQLSEKQGSTELTAKDQGRKRGQRRGGKKKEKNLPASTSHPLALEIRAVLAQVKNAVSTASGVRGCKLLDGDGESPSLSIQLLPVTSVSPDILRSRVTDIARAALVETVADSQTVSFCDDYAIVADSSLSIALSAKLVAYSEEQTQGFMQEVHVFFR